MNGTSETEARTSSLRFSGWSLLLVAVVVSSASIAGFRVQGPAPPESPRLIQQNGEADEPLWIDTADRDAVLAAYVLEYSHERPPIEWSGSLADCSPGDASNELALASIRRVNFYRAMAGVGANVSLDEDYSNKAQVAALMMSAEGRLTHAPEEDYACFDPVGREAAANSNLYLGRTGPESIDGYVEDPGDGNTDVGHRLTVMHPPTEVMGIGQVDDTPDRYEASALWVFDDNVFFDNAPVREPQGFVVWPPRGYVPERVVYPRWSFSMLDADVSGAEVTMTIDGQPVSLEIIERLSKPDQVPSSVVVWEPRGLLGDVGSSTPSTPSTVLEEDVTVQVTISGIQPDPASRVMGPNHPGTSATRGATYSYEVVIMAEEPDSAVSSATDAVRSAADVIVSTVGDTFG